MMRLCRLEMPCLANNWGHNNYIAEFRARAWIVWILDLEIGKLLEQSIDLECFRFDR